jgi:hypothetical protein
MTDEELAQAWHDERHHQEYSSCWCCCDSCNPDYGATEPNPYWEATPTWVRRAREEAE